MRAPCPRCNATAGSFIAKPGEGWVCLGCVSHEEVRHLMVVPSDATELEILLIQSLTQRDDARLLNRTHEALEAAQ